MNCSVCFRIINIYIKMFSAINSILMSIFMPCCFRYKSFMQTRYKYILNYNRQRFERISAFLYASAGAEEICSTRVYRRYMSRGKAFPLHDYKNKLIILYPRKMVTVDIWVRVSAFYYFMLIVANLLLKYSTVLKVRDKKLICIWGKISLILLE